MARESVFVKVSGDLFKTPEFIAGIEKLSRHYFVVICVGGGTQINKALKEAGFDTGIHGPLGRELETLAEKQVARNALEVNQAELQDLLADQGITATVVIPVIEIGTVLCHVNGDQMVQTAYIGFDKLFVVTTPERREKKAEQFKDLPKVQVLSFG